MRILRNYFITGLLTILPIWLVWVVFSFVFGLLSDISQPWVEPILRILAASRPMAFGWVDTPVVMTAVATAGTVALLIGIGAFVRRVVGQRSLAWFEGLVARIPLVNTVYGSTRKLLDLLQTKPGTTQRVVLIDFPHDKMKSVGLVTRTLRDEKTGRELAAVYVPTTPNPTSGYLELVPVEYLTPTDWSVDEAMAFIISGGAVSRERVPFDRNSGSSVET
ncbi:MAG: DUF502 domain-containing protein [Bacteroidetes bacterium]|nr:DUF502 domain-containing protein [Bacteroidota bacterium]